MKSKVCERCGQGFRAKRRDARFCSDRCRKAAKRAENAEKAAETSDENGRKADGGPDYVAQAEAWLRYVEDATGRETGWFR